MPNDKDKHYSIMKSKSKLPLNKSAHSIIHRYRRLAGKFLV